MPGGRIARSSNVEGGNQRARRVEARAGVAVRVDGSDVRRVTVSEQQDDVQCATGLGGAEIDELCVPVVEAQRRARTAAAADAGDCGRKAAEAGRRREI